MKTDRMKEDEHKVRALHSHSVGVNLVFILRAGIRELALGRQHGTEIWPGADRDGHAV